MLIEEHPFHILGITARTAKREIADRVETLSILADPEMISARRLQVTHPVKRISAEVSWFPGLAPYRIRRIIDTLMQDSNAPAGFEPELPGVGSLWTFNALAYWLAAHSDISSETWEILIPRLTASLQEIDADELMAALNGDRTAASMPQITDVTGVREALRQHGENVAVSVPELLLRCNQHARVLSLVIARDTDDGESQSSDFLSCLTDRYHVLVQPSLFGQSDRLDASCKTIISIAKRRSSVGGRMTAALTKLEEILSEWGVMARPIQLLMKSRGLRDTHSIEVAQKVRSAGVTLANEFGLHEEAQQITRSLYGACQEVPELAELLEQDFEALRGIIEARKAALAKKTVQQARFNFDEKVSCPKCGLPMVLQEGPSGNSYTCASPDCHATRGIER